MSRIARGYAVFGALVLAGYAYVALTGWEPAPTSTAFVPASVRTSPGGYRSHHYWHTGYHGGK